VRIILLPTSILFFIFYSFQCLAQKKVVYDTVRVEVVEYEYDTVYQDEKTVDTISVQKGVDTIHKTAEKTQSIEVATPITPSKNKNTLNYFFSACGGFYSTLNQSTTLSNQNSSTTKTVFPNYEIDIGAKRNKWIFAVGFSEMLYSENISYSSTILKYDSIDNGNEIFYRTIEEQKTIQIKNRYRFIQSFLKIGRTFQKNSFSVVPQFLCGISLPISQTEYAVVDSIFDVTTNSLYSIGLVTGLELECMYLTPLQVAISVKPFVKYCANANDKMPFLLNTIVGVNMGITYFLNKKRL